MNPSSSWSSPWSSPYLSTLRTPQRDRIASHLSASITDFGKTVYARFSPLRILAVSLRCAAFLQNLLDSSIVPAATPPSLAIESNRNSFPATVVPAGRFYCRVFSQLLVNLPSNCSSNFIARVALKSYFIRGSFPPSTSHFSFKGATAWIRRFPPCRRYLRVRFRRPTVKNRSRPTVIGISERTVRSR